MQVRKQQLEPDTEQQTGSKPGKEWGGGKREWNTEQDEKTEL